MNHKRTGKTMTVTLTADVVVGTAELIGDHVYVALSSGKIGDSIEYGAVEVYEGVAGGAIGQGKNVKFDNATKKWTVAAADAGGATPGDPIHGVAWSAAAADGDPIEVKIG